MIALFVFLFLAYSFKGIPVNLHIFQQEEYDTRRFLSQSREIKNKLSTHISAVTGALLCTILFPRLINGQETVYSLPITALLYAICFLFYADFMIRIATIKNPIHQAKKKLVITDRAKRIIIVNSIIVIALSVLYAVLLYNIPAITENTAIFSNKTASSALFVIILYLLILCFEKFSPAGISLILANTLLVPFEKSIQQKFYNEARKKITELSPIRIGITGSYGKTSIKHILSHILRCYAPTLMTPGSVNTPMGITRIIREQLEPNHKFFVAEMGAYGPGSIARLCKLVEPEHGIISTIGHAHYERFKSLDAVAQTKFELAESVLQQGNGNIVVHSDTLKFPASGHIFENNSAKFIVVSDNDNLLRENDLRIISSEQTKNGLNVQITWQGKEFNLEAPLFGTHQVSNIALCFAMSCKLGIPVKQVITSLKSAPQIKHRLEVKKNESGGVIIDDAYNSNPTGFISALELMNFLSDNGKQRRILVTPGMVELGLMHDELHAKTGKLAAQLSDIVIIVKPERIKSFVDAYLEYGKDKTCIKVESFSQAQKWISENSTPQDIILLENDLPDIYEDIGKSDNNYGLIGMIKRKKIKCHG